MRASELEPHLTRGHHPVAGLGRALAAGLVLQGVLAILCAGLRPLGVEVLEGFEEFATAYRLTRAAAVGLFLPLAWLWIVWMGRMRANLRALSGDVVGRAHDLPGLPERLTLDDDEVLDLARDWSQDTLAEVFESVETMADAAELRHGPRGVRPLDRVVVLTWLLGGLGLALFVVCDALGLFSDAGPLLPLVPEPALFLVWGAGALLTAATVRRTTRWQRIALPRRAR